MLKKIKIIWYRLFAVIFVSLLIIFFIFTLIKNNSNKEKVSYISMDDINNYDYSNVKTFNLDLHSQEYLLIDLSEYKVLYGYDYEKVIYPASLTKLVTLDTFLHLFSDLADTSSFSNAQRIDLMQQDASLAKLEVDYQYRLIDLLYALILPSGADAAVCLENYAKQNGYDLVEEMNKLCNTLGCKSSHFTNTTGLHDDDLYTSLSDLLLIVEDLLQYEVATNILETVEYMLPNDNQIFSTMFLLKTQKINVLGGKTGNTDESGQSVIVFYQYKNHSYVLMLANAMGHHYKEYYHLDDASTIFEYLYS